MKCPLCDGEGSFEAITLAQHVRYRLFRDGINASKAATDAHTTRATMSRLLQNETISIDTFGKVALWLGITPEQIVAALQAESGDPS